MSAAIAVAIGFLASAHSARAQTSAAPSVPQPIACPASAGPDTTCLSGRDDQGALYVMAMPKDWNRALIVHAHGGPRLGEPEVSESIEDLDRFSVMVRQGYAWVGSTYRRGGYGVRMAVDGVERSRQAFWSHYGRPDRTILHGQSWGGNVAAKTAELFALDGEGRANYDGVLLTNGVVNGGTRAYQFRADLRAVYQYVCRNHPSAQDGVYPVWQGLPPGVTLTRAELRRRVEACTGAGLSMRERTADQTRRLNDILTVTGIGEDELVAHLAWATFLFQDLVHERLEGLNPFDNSATVYAGSSDDAALNAGVERFAADPQAVARLAYDANLSGLIVAPTLSLHARNDPTVFHSAEADYAHTIANAGRAHLLVQATTDEAEHSRLEDASYLTALAALDSWLATGERPDPAAFQARCRETGAGDACRFE